MFTPRFALGSDPEAVQHFNLGNKAFQSGELAQAEREYRVALRIDPAMIDARQNLAITLAQEDHLGAAAEELRRVLEARPNSAEAHYNLGHVL
ncbi:MAG TPA: tetratricopeptide repeat protein, partial [Terriglobia bacterium]|nr:tetratricopeptide repeat protein [Terriglobia bacterium]